MLSWWWMVVGEVLIVVTWLVSVLLRTGFIGRLPTRYRFYYLFAQMFWVAAFFSAVSTDYRRHAILAFIAFTMTMFFFMRLERRMREEGRK